MSIKSCFRFMFLMNIGSMIMLLSECAAPMGTPMKKVENTDTWDRFAAELEALR